MNGVSHVLAVGLVFFLNLGLSHVICEEDTSSDNELSRVRRGGWSMLRLGRGLQMLRLGKRTLPVMQKDNLLDDFYDQEKSYNARQVPLPRYGKDLDWQKYLESRIFGDNSLDEEKRESSIPASSLIEAIDGYRRPAPRGGRFKRGLPNLRFYPEVLQFERAVALPRFGREKEEKIADASKERAVPAPRIGRNS